MSSMAVLSELKSLAVKVVVTMMRTRFGLRRPEKLQTWGSDRCAVRGPERREERKDVTFPAELPK